MTDYVVPPPAISAVPIMGSSQLFPVRRIFCVGRNYAEHAIEMGSDPTREPPFYFTKPADALVINDGDMPYPSMSKSLHYEMELVVAADALDKAVGFISLSHRPILKLGGRSGVIDEVLVTKAWRRRGVGRELLKKVVERAKVLSVKRLEVQSHGAPDEGLLAFFKACGFELASAGVFRLK